MHTFSFAADAYEHYVRAQFRKFLAEECTALRRLDVETAKTDRSLSLEDICLWHRETNSSQSSHLEAVLLHRLGLDKARGRGGGDGVAREGTHYEIKCSVHNARADTFNVCGVRPHDDVAGFIILAYDASQHRCELFHVPKADMVGHVLKQSHGVSLQSSVGGTEPRAAIKRRSLRRRKDPQGGSTGGPEYRLTVSRSKGRRELYAALKLYETTEAALLAVVSPAAPDACADGGADVPPAAEVRSDEPVAAPPEVADEAPPGTSSQPASE